MGSSAAAWDVLRDTRLLSEFLGTRDCYPLSQVSKAFSGVCDHTEILTNWSPAMGDALRRGQLRALRAIRLGDMVTYRARTKQLADAIRLGDGLPHLRQFKLVWYGVGDIDAVLALCAYLLPQTIPV